MFLLFEIIIKLFLVVIKMSFVLHNVSFNRTIDIKIKIQLIRYYFQSGSEKTLIYTNIRPITSDIRKEKLRHLYQAEWDRAYIYLVKYPTLVSPT